MKQASEPAGMWYPMRRADRELSPSEAAYILHEAEYGVLCTCGDDGVPYGVPISFVYDGRTIAFHSATEGHKIQNLQQNAQACFTAVGVTEALPGKFTTRYESAVAFGYLQEVSGERKLDILRALIEKYSSDYREKGEIYISHAADKTAVLELEVVRLSGKAHR